MAVTLVERTIVAGPTILIAEDDDNDVEFLKILFKECRITNPIQVVADGEEVISYLNREGMYADLQKYPDPFLLLLDVRMPKKGALEVLAWLENWEGRSSLVVIVLTAFKDLFLMNNAYALGARSFITKPIDKGEFKSVMSALKGVEIDGQDQLK